MAKVIRLAERRAIQDNLILDKPLEFRRGDWETGFALLCTRKESRRYEAHRRAARKVPGHSHIAQVPNHLKLADGYHYTVRGLFQNRHDSAMMERVYRLAGLMECVTNASSPVLRTDLLRRLYQTILQERDVLKTVWKGNVGQFLLPLYSDHYNRDVFFYRIQTASSLKQLYTVIEEESAEQFLLLGHHYVIYLPESFPNAAGGP